MGDYILLKGEAKKNKEKYMKFRYNKVYAQVRKNYEMWV